MTKRKILIADDEANIRELLNYNLMAAGYDVIQAENGMQAVLAAQEQAPDLIILDIMMPVMDGLSACIRIKENPKTSSLPVIMLSAKGDEPDKVLGLELGADDYIVKPFGIQELLARVKAMFRRSGEKTSDGQLQCGELKLNPNNYEAKISGQKVELTLKEFELLKCLMANTGQVLTRELLLEKIWGYEYPGETRTVDVHIRHLRAKLKEYGNHIETVRGVGYRFSL